MSYNLNVDDQQDFYSAGNAGTVNINNSNGGYDPSTGFFSSQQQQGEQQGHQQQQAFYPPATDYSQSNQQQQGGGFFNPASNNTQFDTSDPFTAAGQQGANGQVGSSEFDNEPPLLEELGINFDHIYKKTLCVLNPFSKPHKTIIHDEDLAGPLVFCLMYGFSLLLVGKIQFGYVYGITALGCVTMYALLNLMSERGVSAVCIVSTLGYCLLPMVLLSFIASLVNLDGAIGLCLSVCFILWCSISSSKLFVAALSMVNQQALILYPCFLLYGIFALLNAF